MLDATAKKLVRLLQPDAPLSVRCAAARVLGEVGGRDAELAGALREALDDPAAELRAEALTAVGKLRLGQTLPDLLRRVSEGGAEAELAAQAAARMGSKGTRALQELMPHVAPGVRRLIAAALGAAGTASSETAATDALLDKDPGVVDAAARSLISEVSALSPAHRKALADHVLELLTTKKGPPLAVASETALVRLLAALHDRRGEALFWERVAPDRPAPLRAAALHALGAFPFSATRTKLRRLLAAAADTDFRVAAPALMLLRTVPLGDGAALRDWLPLLDAPDAAARRFAIEKLGERDTPEVAAALIRQLDHGDKALREEALACLGRLKEGRRALAQALLEAQAPEDAWTLARAQVPLIAAYSDRIRGQLLQQACAYLETDDRRADALLFLLREADARALRDRLEEKALALRKKKDYAKALRYLRVLTRDPACAEAVRFEAAACELKLSGRDLSGEARAADPALQRFARLLHNPQTPPIELVKQAKWLDAEDLFYLGFHFIEGDRQDRDFGAEVLRLVVRRAPQSKRGKDAKSKLRSQGME